MSNLILKAPKYTIIEKTAGELAAAFYEGARGSGLKSKYKNARSWAKANFVKFIPKAVEILTGMLDSHSNISDHMREEIYEAIMERANDPALAVMDSPMLPNGIARAQKNILEDFRNKFDKEFH